MKEIKDQMFEGERPFFHARNTLLHNVTIGEGESAFKFCDNIEAYHCRFIGRYPFWHCNDIKIDNSVLTPEARAALWYCHNTVVENTHVDSPKAFREMDGVTLRHVNFTDAQETFWHCYNVNLEDVEIRKADNVFMCCRHIRIDGYRQQGKYAFQYCSDIEIHNAEIDTKDAFWETENVTIYDSVIKGEYLGWHSKRLKLVRCKISGTQPLCYADDLVLEDCEMDPSCDLCFEDSEVNAVITTPVTSIKNPRKGVIVCKSVGERLIDEYSRALDEVKIIEK